MRKATKDVSMHQLIYIMFFSSIIHKVIFIPSRIVQIAFRDVWISVALFVVLDIFHIVLFYIAIQYNPDMTFTEMLEKTLGKVAAKIITGLLAFYLLIRVANMIDNYNLYAADVLYPVSWRPPALPIIVVSVFCAYRGLRTIARINELLGTGIALIIITTMVLVAVSSDFSNILPIMESGFKPALNGFNDHILLAGDYFCVMCLMGRIKVEKGFGLNIAIPVIVSSVLSIVFAMAYYSFYEDIAVFQKQGHALSDIALFLLGTESLARFDFVFAAMWMIAILLRVLINTWVYYNFVQETLGLSDSVVHKYVLSGIVILTIWLFYRFMTQNTLFFENLITSDFKYFVFIPIHIVLPIMVPILTILATKKDRKQQQQQQQQQNNPDYKLSVAEESKS